MPWRPLSFPANKGGSFLEDSRNVKETVLRITDSRAQLFDLRAVIGEQLVERYLVAHTVQTRVVYP